jgi:hypothetical protein
VLGDREPGARPAEIDVVRRDPNRRASADGVGLAVPVPGHDDVCRSWRRLNPGKPDRGVVLAAAGETQARVPEPAGGKPRERLSAPGRADSVAAVRLSTSRIDHGHARSENGDALDDPTGAAREAPPRSRARLAAVRTKDTHARQHGSRDALERNGR